MHVYYAKCTVRPFSGIKGVWRDTYACAPRVLQVIERSQVKFISRLSSHNFLCRPAPFNSKMPYRRQHRRPPRHFSLSVWWIANPKLTRKNSVVPWHLQDWLKDLHGKQQKIQNMISNVFLIQNGDKVTQGTQNFASELLYKRNS